MVVELENGFRLAASIAALAVEAAAVLAIAIGATEAVWCTARHVIQNESPLAARAIWVRFASWILLSLEFTLGADIIRSAIAPGWQEIGKLAAIAFIRTALNYFLNKDVAEFQQTRAAAENEAAR